MSFQFSAFDRTLLKTEPLSERKNNLTLSDISDIKKSSAVGLELRCVASNITAAKKLGSSVILMAGAHVLRAGVQRYLIDLMEKGYVLIREHKNLL
jgi:hypothetical protein